MAGIYFHIPWCRKVCIYCDFHFSLAISNKQELLECILSEIKLQKDYLGREVIESVYFGGGTPSVLTAAELGRILDTTASYFNIAKSAEITIEANPEDLNIQYLKDLKNLGINRLSIGVQSFSDADLRWMNRRHDGKQAFRCITDSKKAGFDNINIDLIYGLPGMNKESWHENLKVTFKNNVQHLSAYNLTLEEKTVYSYRIRKGEMKKPDEATGLEHFNLLMEIAGKEGFLHYEISNFCLPGFFSLHNTSYWKGKSYLGIGPSANSYNGNSRQWNIRNNTLYIKSIKDGIVPYDHEELGRKEKYNEYILTSLRTMWGIDTGIIEQRFGPEFLDYFRKEVKDFISRGELTVNGSGIVLSNKGKCFADRIISGLFWTG